MLITRTSQLSGQVHTLDLPVTTEQIDNWRNGMLIQSAMPNLTPAQREFFLTGSTQEEWDTFFGPEEETY